MWDRTREAIGGSSIAPDLYGFGDSLGEWADGVLALAPSEPFVVVGCSVGVSCAFEIAHRRPDLVAGMVAVGGKPGVNPDPRLRDEAVECLERSGFAAAWDRYWRPLFAPGVEEGIVTEAFAQGHSLPVDDLVRGVRAFHDREDRSDALSTWPGPLVAVSGTHDPAPTPAVMRTFAAGPGRRFVPVDGAGHYVNLERPVAFVEILRRALDEWRGRA